MSTAAVVFQTLLQGLYSIIWIAILLDVGSPSLDLRNLPELSAVAAIAVGAVLLILAYAVGVMMHTLSRYVFRRQKDEWAYQVISSTRVQDLLTGVGAQSYLRSTGAPTLKEVSEAEGFSRIRKAGEIILALNYAVMMRAPGVYRSIQVYRDQY